jgi:hypothetical protein
MSRDVHAALAAALALLALAGCAGQNAAEIAQWQQQERDRLEAQGFPQYGPPGG